MQQNGLSFRGLGVSGRSFIKGPSSGESDGQGMENYWKLPVYRVFMWFGPYLSLNDNTGPIGLPRNRNTILSNLPIC